MYYRAWRRTNISSSRESVYYTLDIVRENNGLISKCKVTRLTTIATNRLNYRIIVCDYFCKMLRLFEPNSFTRTKVYYIYKWFLKNKATERLNWSTNDKCMAFRLSINNKVFDSVHISEELQRERKLVSLSASQFWGKDLATLKNLYLKKKNYLESSLANYVKVKIL